MLQIIDVGIEFPEPAAVHRVSGVPQAKDNMMKNDLRRRTQSKTINTVNTVLKGQYTQANTKSRN